MIGLTTTLEETKMMQHTLHHISKEVGALRRLVDQARKKIQYTLWGLALGFTVLGLLVSIIAYSQG